MKNFLLHVQFEDGSEQHSYQPAEGPWGTLDIDNHKKDSENHQWVKLKKKRPLVDWGNPFGEVVFNEPGFLRPMNLGMEHGVTYGTLQGQVQTRTGTQYMDEAQAAETWTRYRDEITAGQPRQPTARVTTAFRPTHEQEIVAYQRTVQAMNGEADRRAAQRERDLARARGQQDQPVQRNEQPRTRMQRIRNFFGGNND